MTPSHQKKELKRSMAIVIIVSLFLVCWIPFIIVLSVSNVSDDSKFDEKINFIRTIFSFIFVTNSFINPILYFWKLHKFRFSQTHNSRETTTSPGVVTRAWLILRCKFSVE